MFVYVFGCVSVYVCECMFANPLHWASAGTEAKMINVFDLKCLYIGMIMILNPVCFNLWLTPRSKIRKQKKKEEEKFCYVALPSAPMQSVFHLTSVPALVWLG